MGVEPSWWGFLERCGANAKRFDVKYAVRHRNRGYDIGAIMNKYLSGGDVKQVKKIADKEVKGHEKRLHGMNSGGVVVRGGKAQTKGKMARGPMG